ncbi:hypothetical protein M422DRAFT_244132 [Sphaerobolus stellatus SS14]|nr:hypothetical protein M422DRAFT_244132 [Sphaerobolus stellatus SS14]
MPRTFIEAEDRQRNFATEEVKEIAVYQQHTLNYKIEDIARNLRMSKRTVERVLELWKTTGEVIPKDSKGRLSRRKLMSEQEQEYLLELVKSRPDLYLDELQKRLQEMFELYIGISTIWDTLTDLGLTRKRLSKAAAERNEEARALYKFRIGAESPEQLVFIDESRIDCRATYRLYGWAEKGKRARAKARFVRGPSYSLLPALCSEGIIHAHTKQGSYDGEDFIAYIEELLSKMNPWPQPRGVLVMDNCSIHHVDDVALLCAARGIRLYYLPPYSPDYNPIEEAFGYVKSVIRRDGDKFRDAVDRKNEHAVFYYLHSVLATITPEMVEGWMGHSGYISVVYS